MNTIFMFGKSKPHFKKRDREQNQEHIYGAPEICGEFAPWGLFPVVFPAS